MNTLKQLLFVTTFIIAAVPARADLECTSSRVYHKDFSLEKLDALLALLPLLDHRPAGGSFQSTSAPQVHVSIPPGTRSLDVDVRWPDGTTEQYEQIEVAPRVILRRSP